MVGSRKVGGRRAALGAVAAWLALTTPSVAAPPTISGADGDAWNSAPTYVVTGGEWGVAWNWQSTSGQAALSTASPFQVTLTRGLADGTHRLVVGQINSPAAPGERARPRRETATRTFVIDTVAPAPLALSGPGAITAGEAIEVSWSGVESGATVAWRVVAAGSGEGDGPAEQGPVETTAPGATIAGLGPGEHEVRAVQRDAAGNVSAIAALPVSVLPAPVSVPAPVAPPAAALEPPPPPVAVPAAAAPRPAVRLPARNPARMRPRRGASLRVVRPVLRWRKGPKGTRLYNVQLFRVRAFGGGRSSDTVTLRKVRSAFPRANHLRTHRLARGACYVWRVWPYRTTGAFTSQPLGVSHFCVSRRPAARR